MHIGSVTRSTFAIGSNAHAESHHGVSQRHPEFDEEFLNAVRELRADLTRVQQTAQTVALDATLAETEEEINLTGTASEGVRHRLREMLSDSQAVLTLIASAASVAGLLGM
ncbi:hypothetical protein AB0O75_45100 [Streptomyces sp. NPDC088921]|uniref:hypothetical protein n=1 Tax=unclassified Streptomyces TaxID=2593676 RepID=UPI003433422C